MIEKNVGGLDRWVRLVAGVALAAVGIAGGLGYLPALGALGGAILMAASAGLLFNAVTQRCLANHLLGVDTCTRPDADLAGGSGD